MANAATSSGAIKAWLESQGLGISVYRDRAPENASLTSSPYAFVTVTEAISEVPDPLEDGAYSTGRELVQIDVWMQWRDKPGGTITESYTLPRDIVRALQGHSLDQAPTRAYAVIVQHLGPRTVDEEENVVHVPITAEIVRQL